MENNNNLTPDVYVHYDDIQEEMSYAGNSHPVLKAAGIALGGGVLTLAGIGIAKAIKKKPEVNAAPEVQTGRVFKVGDHWMQEIMVNGQVFYQLVELQEETK